MIFIRGSKISPMVFFTMSIEMSYPGALPDFKRCTDTSQFFKSCCFQNKRFIYAFTS